MKVWLCRHPTGSYYGDYWVDIYAKEPKRINSVLRLAGEEKRLGTVLYTDLKKWFGIKLKPDELLRGEISFKSKRK